MSKYKFKNKEDYIIYVPELSNKLLFETYFICNYGFCTIDKGYSWDGCTLAPDTPETYNASLVHDALYQYGKQLGLRRIIADRLFKRLLGIEMFKWSNLYFYGVRLFGWVFY